MIMFIVKNQTHTKLYWPNFSQMYISKTQNSWSNSLKYFLMQIIPQVQLFLTAKDEQSIFMFKFKIIWFSKHKIKKDKIYKEQNQYCISFIHHLFNTRHHTSVFTYNFQYEALY